MDLPSVLGGLAQGFTDFGKSVVDLFGTGGAAIGDLLQGTGTRNQDDFRKWLYNTDSVKDAAAKGLGTALNGVQTVSDYIPGINVLTRNPLGNAAQGALGGLADEFKMAGENYDLGRAGQRAAVSGAAALAGSSLGDALKKSANPLFQSGLAQGLARGATGGAINQGGYAAIDGGDIMQSALQGAGLGALIGGATGAVQDFIPRKRTTLSLPTDEDMVIMAERDPLGSTLADADMVVNSAKIAPGQLDLFSDYKPKPKAEAPVNGLDYYGSDIEMLAPGNPYAPVDGQVTQAMRDRANYIIDDLALHKQIPENELFNKIDPKTLPKGHYETGKILDEAYSAGQDAKALTYEAVNNVLKKELGDNPSKEKLISYLYDGMDEAEKKAAVDAEIGLYMEPEKLSELSLETIARRKVMQDIYGDNSTPLYSGNRTVRGGYTGALDSVLSERLGIAPGNTYKKIGHYDQPNGVAGRYSYSPSIASQENIMVGPTLNNEDAINTVAHERLHSFQGEAKELNDRFNRYDPEVRQAYSDLAQDLKKAKAYNTGKEVEKRYGRSVAYWRHHDEQESRMLQQYLDAKGYTASKHHNANQYLGLEFDDAKIIPAFDKFFDKLRDLSKRGVALPALATLFGGGALLATQNNDKEKEVK